MKKRVCRFLGGVVYSGFAIDCYIKVAKFINSGRGIEYGRSKCFGLLLVGMVMVIPGESSAAVTYPVVSANVVRGYSKCEWIDRGEETTIRFQVAFYAANEAGVPGKFLSRAVMLYGYTDKGTIASNFKAESVRVGSTESRGVVSAFAGGTTYHGYDGGSDYNQWLSPISTTLSVEIDINNSYFNGWAGVTVRGANWTGSSIIADRNGGAFVAKGDHVSGACRVNDPTNPPVPDIAIEMTAPDWDLSELPFGEGLKTFTNPAEQLCFTYTGWEIGGKSFIVNAGNANGIANNRYRLKNVDDSSQLVPYRVTLDSGTSKLTLPNTGSSALSLSSSGRTCFVPTFETFVEDRVKEGAYSDVLQFNVVTKP
ncbi:hypothetical protein [Burkholderia diffusa]|uniref:hypothetical protein n=1 Tax=Burkholderia diffusa TaxID=488732 RepID=UPI0012D9D0A9|nr:hypothetical protein [Burkholderia diffusa]